jgi:thiopurine S-methyltransferase
VTLSVGDIFNLDRDTLGEVDAIYDRAALQLLVTFEYDQTHQPGPLFSVLEEEVRAHYGATYRLDRVEVRKALS